MFLTLPFLSYIAVFKPKLKLCIDLLSLQDAVFRRQQ